jgi:amino acid permease
LTTEKSAAVADQPGLMSATGAMFTILSTIVGGGMVSLPWAFFECGFPTAILVLLVTEAQVFVSCYLYLKARSICPDNPSSMYEMGFIIVGRGALFWIAFTIFVNSFLLPIIYMNVIGDVMKTLVYNLTN